MTTTAARVMCGCLVLALIAESSALIRTSKSRSELERLRSELRIWAASQKVCPGMSAAAARSILGDPEAALPGPSGQLHLLYHVKPTWLPDNGLHISGCRVVRTNDVVAECSLSTAIKAR